ncbi:MAG: alpha/beta hydrolase [Anaerolineae bacterium]
MDVQNETELITFRDWTLRVRPAVQHPARLLLLVHGWTGDENSMWVFAHNLPASYHIVAPRAPYVTRPSGYSWRPQESGDHDRPTFEQLHPAADALIQGIDAYASANHIDSSSLDAMGFSQGAALVGSLSLLYPARIGRAALLAGFLPEGAQPLVGPRPLDGKPFFVGHGTRDERVPVAEARRSVELLERAGATVVYCEDDVGHKLGLKCLHALRAFFAPAAAP